MLAELAAANAAFAIIKETIANGRELYECGDALADYFGCKAKLQKKAHEHGYKSDLQAFLAAEKLRENEQTLKEMMIWQGRASLYTDWLAYQKQMKNSREAEERAEKAKKIKRRRLLVDWAIGITVTLCVLTAVGLLAYIFWYVMSAKLN